VQGRGPGQPPGQRQLAGVERIDQLREAEKVIARDGGEAAVRHVLGRPGKVVGQHVPH